MLCGAEPKFSCSNHRKTQRVKNSLKFCVIVIADFFGCTFFLFCSNGDGCAVAVAAGNIEDAVAFHTIVARQYVAGQKAGNVSDVQ